MDAMCGEGDILYNIDESLFIYQFDDGSCIWVIEAVD